VAKGVEMLGLIDFSGRPFHFIGIGGIGMSAIAHVLVKQGYAVSGSDLNQNRITSQLQDLGVIIYEGQSADNISALAQPQIICSTAISDRNPEFQAAKALDLPIFHRSDVLAALISQFEGIAVAGTHGKTTTSSLTAYLFLKAGLDPTIIVGGEVSAWKGNARMGKSKYLIAEADESDGSLVKFHPHLGAITNIELDHPDHYQNLEQVVETFQTFAKQCDILVACIDDPNICAHIQPDITYSLSAAKNADYYPTNVQYNANGTVATIVEKGEILGQIELRILGKHNLSNALAAISIARYAEIEWSSIVAAMAEFIGASRRFELKGNQSGIVFVDDYAHHPSEIRATLSSARLQSQNKTQSKIVAIFQPHRYSRTQTLLSDFSQAFGDADTVVVTDIYAAGEKDDGSITGAQVAAAIAATHPHVSYQPSLPLVQTFLTENLKSGDLAIFLGAGNLNQIIAPTIEAMANCSTKK